MAEDGEGEAGSGGELGARSRGKRPTYARPGIPMRSVRAGDGTCRAAGRPSDVMPRWSCLPALEPMV